MNSAIAKQYLEAIFQDYLNHFAEKVKTLIIYKQPVELHKDNAKCLINFYKDTLSNIRVEPKLAKLCIESPKIENVDKLLVW